MQVIVFLKVKIVTGDFDVAYWNDLCENIARKDFT